MSTRRWLTQPDGCDMLSSNRTVAIEGAEHEDRVRSGLGGRAPRTAGEGEGGDPRPGRAGRAAPPDAVAAGDEGVRVRRPGWPDEPARPLRRAPPADRVPHVLRARRVRLARARAPGLLAGGRPGRARRP